MPQPSNPDQEYWRGLARRRPQVFWLNWFFVSAGIAAITFNLLGIAHLVEAAREPEWFLLYTLALATAMATGQYWQARREG